MHDNRGGGGGGGGGGGVGGGGGLACAVGGHGQRIICCWRHALDRGARPPLIHHVQKADIPATAACMQEGGV
jgi:hypothetical protein